MSEVGGYRRDGRLPGGLRLDLNEAPREAGDELRSRVLAILAALPWRRYPDMDAAAARDAAAAVYGWDAEGTAVGNGSNELLAALVRRFVPAGGTLVTLGPSFSIYPVLAARSGATHLQARLDPPGFTLDGDELVDLASRADLVVLCSPNNPTGGEVGESIMERVLALGKVVVWDAAYVEFARRDPVPLLSRSPRLVVLRTLSKAWGMAGLRAGAMLATPELVRETSHELLPFGTGVMVAAAYQAARELGEHSERLVEEVIAERDRELEVVGRIPGVGAVPSAGNFFLLRRQRSSGDELARDLRARGVAVRRIPELDAHGYVRVTVGARSDGDRFLAAVREVARA